MPAFAAPLLMAVTMAPALPVAAAPAAPASHPPAAHAAAKATPLTSDIRCLLVMALLSQDKAHQQPAVIGSYFFAGRITARAPGLDLPSAVKAEEPHFSKADLQPELSRCGAIVQASAVSLRNTFSPPGAGPPAGTAPAPSPGPAAPMAAPPK